jgi:hypothetical protein
MKVIVFEGPDEGGKTTLLRATVEVLEATSRPFTVVKSPAGSDMGWSPAWENWSDHQVLDNRVDDVTRHVFLLDRTPELSEFVYGVSRGHSRQFNPLDSLHRFRLGQKMLVLCLPSTIQLTKQGHQDPFGNEMGEWMTTVGIHQLYKALLMLYSHTMNKDFRFFWWDKLDTPNMWAKYLVSLAGYVGLSPTELTENYYSKMETLFPKEG